MHNGKKEKVTMKFSDLDIDIPSSKSDYIKSSFIKASKNVNGLRSAHPSGIYLYNDLPAYNGYMLMDYKVAEKNGYQKIDILNNTFLDDIECEYFSQYLELIENEQIDWNELYKYENAYQLSHYPNILKEFKVTSVMDIAIVLAIIRPGSYKQYERMKKYIHTDKILSKLSDDEHKILSDTYGIPVFDEQYKALYVDDGLYRYKKPHSIGYAYVLLVDFLKNTLKK